MPISPTGLRTLCPHAEYLSTLERLWPGVHEITSGQGRPRGALKTEYSLIVCELSANGS